MSIYISLKNLPLEEGYSIKVKIDIPDPKIEVDSPSFEEPPEDEIPLTPPINDPPRDKPVVPEKLCQLT